MHVHVKNQNTLVLKDIDNPLRARRAGGMIIVRQKTIGTVTTLKVSRAIIDNGRVAIHLQDSGLRIRVQTPPNGNRDGRKALNPLATISNRCQGNLTAVESLRLVGFRTGTGRSQRQK